MPPPPSCSLPPQVCLRFFCHLLPFIRAILTTKAAVAGLEMLAEPLYILSHNLMLINIRVRVEMAALALKVLSTSLAGNRRRLSM